VTFHFDIATKTVILLVGKFFTVNTICFCPSLSFSETTEVEIFVLLHTFIRDAFLKQVFRVDFFVLFQYFIQRCHICFSSDSSVSENDGIEPWTVATSAFAVRRSNYSARSHPPLTGSYLE
jgi:hypothetical protein